MGIQRLEGCDEAPVRELLRLLPPPLDQWVGAIPEDQWAVVEEVRVRTERPVSVYGPGAPRFVGPKGLLRNAADAPRITRETMERWVEVLADRSLYARQAELAEGYLALPGGHRLGVVGQAVLLGGRVKTTRDWTGLNLRIAHRFQEAADPLMRRVDEMGPGGASVLVVGPPRSGKTTVLRAAIGRLSARGWRLVVVDERRELGPAHPDDLHVDVLAGWPKSAGIMAAIRALGPDVLLVDELGQATDADAVRRARESGVNVWASAHGGAGAPLGRHPVLRGLLAHGVFDAVAELAGDGSHRVVRVWRP